MKAIYDCLVVGAGSVGGVCAYELAKRGLKVLILEKERLPRPKVRAGASGEGASTFGFRPQPGL